MRDQSGEEWRREYDASRKRSLNRIQLCLWAVFPAGAFAEMWFSGYSVDESAGTAIVAGLLGFAWMFRDG